MKKIIEKLKIVFWTLITVVVGMLSYWFARKKTVDEFERKEKELRARLEELEKREERIKTELAVAVSNRKELLNLLEKIKEERKQIKEKIGEGSADEKADDFDYLLGGITRKRTKR